MTGMLAEGAAAVLVILLDLRARGLLLVAGRLCALPMQSAARVGSQDEPQPEEGEKQEGRARASSV